MIDLTNKTEEELNVLIEKYKLLLEMVNDQTKLPLFAYIINAAVEYLNNNHNDYNSHNKSWKALCVLTIIKMHLYYDDEIQLHMLIDEFHQYTINEYQNYIVDIAMYASTFDRDFGFINKFILFYEAKYDLITK